MNILTVSCKGQLVIPEKVRKKLNIKEGSKLVLFEKGNTLILKKEEEVSKQILWSEKKEQTGWMILAEQSLKKVWDNKKDEEVWKRYL